MYHYSRLVCARLKKKKTVFDKPVTLEFSFFKRKYFIGVGNSLSNFRSLLFFVDKKMHYTILKTNKI